MTFAPRRGFLNKGIVYEESGAQKIVPFIKNNAKEFFSDQMTISARENLFKSLLTHEVVEGINSIDSEMKKSIVEEFPFIFGAQTLPKEMRYIIYAIKEGYDFGNIKPEWFTKMNEETFNSVVYEAIYESLKYQKPYLALAYDRYKEIRKYLKYANDNPGTIQRERNIMNTLNQTNRGFWDVAKSAVSGIGSFLYNQLAKLDQNIFLDSTSNEFFRDTLTKAKIYGEVIINCAYLERYGIKEVHEGIIIIFEPNYPQLRFQITNSKIVVYIERNGKVQEIEETVFTMEFLRALIKEQFASRAGKVLKKYNEMVDSDTKNSTTKQQFQNYFYTQGNLQRGVKPYTVFN